MNDETQPTLPDKCCANCGFLHGLGHHAASREDAVFDPDLIRSAEYPPFPMGSEQAPGIITSLPYDFVSEDALRNQSTYTSHYAWAHTHSICCYKKEFRAIAIPRLYPSPDPHPERYIPIDIDTVLNAIRQDRTQCDGFLSYLPGFSPSQHASLQIDQQRETSAREHERVLVKWSLDQEERWRKADAERETQGAKLEEQWRHRERRLVIILAIIGSILTAIQIVADVVISLK